MNALVSPHARRAALAVHGLCKTDQEAVLSRLEPRERASLEPLLRELDELGLPPMPGLATLIRPPEPPVAHQAGLASATAREMDQVLRREPEVLVARLLLAGPWPWASAFVRLQPHSRRRRINQAMQALLEAGERPDEDPLRQALVEEAELIRQAATADGGQEGAALPGRPLVLNRFTGWLAAATRGRAS